MPLRFRSPKQYLDAERLRLVLGSAGNADLWRLHGLVEGVRWHQVCEGFIDRSGGRDVDHSLGRQPMGGDYVYVDARACRVVYPQEA